MVQKQPPHFFMLSILFFCLLACTEFAEVVGGQPSASSTEVKRKKHGISKESGLVIKEPEASLPLQFIWPVKGGKMTSGFGKRRKRTHDGLDISAPKGTPVMAAESGNVLFAGRLSYYGNLVILKHAGNYFTAYGHLSQYHVKKGQNLKQGQVIGAIGRTGRATSNHLHFEVRHQTKALDPMRFLPAQS